MLPPRHRLLLIAGAAALALGLAPTARAQSLLELYDAAHGFDATYLAARALADSAQYRVEQVEALNRPSAAATASIGNSRTDLPVLGSSNGASRQAGVNGRYPLLNRANSATIAQARKSLDTAQADLDSAEQDLILRVAQAYFDVLAAQEIGRASCRERV